MTLKDRVEGAQVERVASLERDVLLWAWALILVAVSAHLQTFAELLVSNQHPSELHMGELSCQCQMDVALKVSLNQLSALSPTQQTISSLRLKSYSDLMR